MARQTTLRNNALHKALTTYLIDVLQRISMHPANRTIELTPRRWKSLFADNPLSLRPWSA